MKSNIERRQFITFASVGVIGSFAGCSGAGDQSATSTGTEGTRSTQANDDGGEIAEVRYEDGQLVVELVEDHTADRIGYGVGEGRPGNVLVDDGTTVPVLSIGQLELIEAPGETVQLEAVRDGESDDKVVGEAEILYDPEVAVTAVEVLFETGDLAVEIENRGTGPLEIHPFMSFEEWANLRPADEAFATSISQLAYPTNATVLNDIVDKAILEAGETVRISSEETDATPLESEVTVSGNAEGRYGTITPDETTKTAVLEVGLDSSPSELRSTFEADIEFSGIEAELEREQTDYDYFRYNITYRIGDGETVSISPPP